MPPSFAPKEKRRERDVRPPRERDLVDAIVARIKQDYADKMRKKGQVDNKGEPIRRLDDAKLRQEVERRLRELQQDNRRHKKKRDGPGFSGAVARSISEAVGKRVQERIGTRSPERKSDSRSDSDPKKQADEGGRKESRRKRVPVEVKSKGQRRAETSVVEDKAKKRYRGKDVERYHEINHYTPKIRGEEVKSYRHLQKIVKGEFLGFMRKEDFGKLMDGARKHFELVERLRGREHLEYGELAKIARELDLSTAMTKVWSLRVTPPKIYTLLDTAISKSEGLVQVEKLTRLNKGAMDLKEINRRLGHYYAEKEYRNSPTYKKDLDMASRYFKFLDLLKVGGSMTEMGRQIDTHQSMLRRWWNGKSPWMVKLAASIPNERPAEGHKWLPTITGLRNNPREFIEVPLGINDYRDVLHVIDQLKSLDSENARRLEERFGPSSKIDSFMYVLGSLLSDGSTQFVTDANTASSRINQPLGRAYDWSKTYGEGNGYHLSRIGIEMRRIADYEYNPDLSSYPSSGAYSWQSQFTPLITWMRRTCLGLKDTASKTYNPVDADWILSAPMSWKKPFLHGLCDGDGCASKASQYLSIATSTNSRFFQDLLKSMKMTSHEGDGAVVIGSHESVRRASEIGIFRYATSRKENLAKLAEMMDTYDNARDLKPDEIALVKEMRSQGKSWGAISEAVFDKFGHTWPYYTIMRRTRKLGIK